MTMNGHFALKSGPSSASNGLAFWLSEKTVWKFVELRIILLAVTEKFSPARDCTGDISVMGLIHWRYPKRKRQTSELYSHSQFSHMPFTVTDVCRKISKIQE